MCQSMVVVVRQDIMTWIDLMDCCVFEVCPAVTPQHNSSAMISFIFLK